VEVPLERMYDWRADPQEFRRNYSLLNGLVDITLAEKAIRKAGFWGYFVGDVAAVFVPLDNPLRV